MVNPVESFESGIEELLGTKYAVGVCNGTAALHTALVSCGIGEGDEVITTPYTFPATANAIRMARAKPVFADVHRESLCLDPWRVDAAIAAHPKVRAIIGVDIFGRLHGVEELADLAEEYELIYIEDASQAFGAKKNGQYAGTFGEVGTFSFYASKNLWSFEGGMLITDCDEIAEQARMIRNHGLNSSGEMVRMGYNYKMPWICAFIAETNLRLHLPGLLAELGRYGPEDGYYSKLVYQHKYYKDLGLTGDCPVAEIMARKVK